MMELAGKKALVTGAASGIGRATAIRFAEEGAEVTIGDVNAAGLDETAALMARPPRVQPFDAADFASCRKLVEVAAQDGLDILANISGILRWGPSLDFTEEQFAEVMAVNTTSVYALCRAALPHLIERRGTIVNTASTAAHQGIAYTVAYTASKHAVAAITKSLAIEFADRGVRINAVSPGQVDTAMGHAPPPPGEMNWDLVLRNTPKLVDGIAAPSDIAEAMLFLSSARARKITGTLLVVDAGLLAG